jgi:hypothetical protein
MNFPLYRTRNHLIGLSGLYISSGIGLACLFSVLNSKKYCFLSINLILLTFFGILCYRSFEASRTTSKYLAKVATIDPCEWIGGSQISLDVVVGLKSRYPLDDPRCEEALLGAVSGEAN